MAGHKATDYNGFSRRSQWQSSLIAGSLQYPYLFYDVGSAQQQVVNFVINFVYAQTKSFKGWFRRHDLQRGCFTKDVVLAVRGGKIKENVDRTQTRSLGS